MLKGKFYDENRKMKAWQSVGRISPNSSEGDVVDARDLLDYEKAKLYRVLWTEEKATVSGKSRG